MIDPQSLLMVVSLPLLQVYFSNNDFLGVRVFGHQGYTKGELRVIWPE